MRNVICKVRIILLSFPIIFTISAIATAKNFSYKIIEVNRHGTTKCDLTIRLNKKVSPDTLRKLAIELRDKEPKKYERMFITYYLTGMTVGSGAWATTHFNPNLEVKILGLTAQEEQNLLKEKKNIHGKIIGVWVDELMGLRVTIIKKSYGYIIENKFKDGSGSTKDLIRFKVRGKLAFKEIGNTEGEYYILERSGNLGVYDPLGLITTMRSIK